MHRLRYYRYISRGVHRLRSGDSDVWNTPMSVTKSMSKDSVDGISIGTTTLKIRLFYIHTADESNLVSSNYFGNEDTRQSLPLPLCYVIEKMEENSVSKKIRGYQANLHHKILDAIIFVANTESNIPRKNETRSWK